MAPPAPTLSASRPAGRSGRQADRPSPPGAWMALLLATPFLLAGCAAPGDDTLLPTTSSQSPLTSWSTTGSPGSTAPFTSGSSSPDPGSACPSRPCNQGRMWEVEILLPEPAESEVGVPLPTAGGCLRPSQWTLHAEQAHNATAEVRTADRGEVLWVRSAGYGSFRASLRPGAEPCAPGEDRWSVEPDPAEGVLEVLAAAPARIHVYVHDWDGYCSDTVTFVGEAAAGWSPIPQGWAGRVCD
jgi:hypothetical protein